MALTNNRRDFLIGSTLAGASWLGVGRLVCSAEEYQSLVAIPGAISNLDVFDYLESRGQPRNAKLFRQVLGAANAFKEGDAAIGLAAVDDRTREKARELLSRTKIESIDSIPLVDDELTTHLSRTVSVKKSSVVRSLGDLKSFLLKRTEEEIKQLSSSLSSTVIGCVVKLMSNAELVAVGSKIFNSLPGSRIGAKGYLGARIQPNSPTDNIDDIRWQVFDGWSYAVGDVVLGTNPVSSNPRSVAAIELALKDLITTFELEEVLPHCVLAHIDVQAEVEANQPGSTGVWFQSIAGTDTANKTFDISVQKMLDYASKRNGRYGLYFETGQGADFTNGHGHGFDMVLHEARKYGFARLLKQHVAKARGVSEGDVWLHLNDVAGFIGPEVFRTREQLVRCCLEDIVMGKLHGLTIGLDVCSTLHMDVSLDDLDWCLDQIMPANPAYLMALPTKIDPMLGYLTTGFQDHVRIRNRFGFRVNDRMWDFFKEIGVIGHDGKPTQHFGDPIWVYEQYRLKKGDVRESHVIRAEARAQMESVRKRGVFIAEGAGVNSWDLKPSLKKQISYIYDDAKKSIWAEWDPEFMRQIPSHVLLQTNSVDRTDYILHPSTGERLSESSVRKLESIRSDYADQFDLQIVISEGLNALSLMERDHLQPFVNTLQEELKKHGLHVAPKLLVVQSGRVRAGYQIGEIIYRGLPGQRSIVHIIGERPGTGHRTFSAYLTAASGDIWGKTGQVDHNITKVVSGIAKTALLPVEGAHEVREIITRMVQGRT